MTVEHHENEHFDEEEQLPPGINPAALPVFQEPRFLFRGEADKGPQSKYEGGEVHEVEQEAVPDSRRVGEATQIVREQIGEGDIVRPRRKTSPPGNDCPGESMENDGFPPGK